MAGLADMQQAVAALRDDISQIRCDLKKETEDRYQEGMALVSSVQALNSAVQNDEFERSRKNKVIDEFIQATTQFMQQTRQQVRSEEDERKKVDMELLTAIKKISESAAQEALGRIRQHSQIDDILESNDLMWNKVQADLLHEKVMREKDDRQIFSAIQSGSDSQATTVSPHSLASRKDELTSTGSDWQDAFRTRRETPDLAGETSEDVQRAISSEIAESMKKVMAIVESEKAERKTTYSLLQSHLGNFQYDMAVERNERNQLQSEIVALKAEVKSRKGNDILLSPPSSFNDDVDIPSTGKEIKGQIDKLVQEVRQDVVSTLGEYQHRHKELRDLVTTLCTQEKLTRDSQIGIIHQNLEKLENMISDTADTSSLPGMGRMSRNESHTESNLMIGFQDEKLDTLLRHDQQLRAIAQQDFICRDELDHETRRLWEVMEHSSVSRDEFESNAQRLWEAIMQLQAKQLEDIKRQAREEAQSLASVSTGATMLERAQSGKGGSKSLTQVTTSTATSTPGDSARAPAGPAPGSGSGTYPNPSAGSGTYPNPGAGSGTYPNPGAGPAKGYVSPGAYDAAFAVPTLSNSASGVPTVSSPSASLRTIPAAHQGAPVMPAFSGSSSPPVVAVPPPNQRTSLGGLPSPRASPRTSLVPQPNSARTSLHPPQPSPRSRSRNEQTGTAAQFQPSVSKPSFAKVGAVGPQRCATSPTPTLCKSQENVRVDVAAANTSAPPQHPPTVSPRFSTKDGASNSSQPQHPPTASPRLSSRPDMASPRVSFRSSAMTPRTKMKHEQSYTYSC